MQTRVVITKDQEHRYTINDYALKVIQSSPTELKASSDEATPHTFQSFDEEGSVVEQAPAVTPQPQVAQEGTATPSNSERDELVESLLKKADDFSSKYIKAQMQYEQALEEGEAKAKLAHDQGYQDGLTAAREQMQQEIDAKQAQILAQLESSIATLNNQANDFANALDGVNEELIGAALDIAKEVIQKELRDDSAAVAASLATALMQDIKDASRVTLKVNPLEVDKIKQSVGESASLTVEADSAIREGGVVLISDIGTIEADIMQRYEKIKRHAVQDQTK